MVLSMRKQQAKLNTNSTVDKYERREWQRCPVCPPNKGENSNRKAVHGKTKPKYKTKAKGR